MEPESYRTPFKGTLPMTEWCPTESHLLKVPWPSKRATPETDPLSQGPLTSWPRLWPSLSKWKLVVTISLIIFTNTKCGMCVRHCAKVWCTHAYLTHPRAPWEKSCNSLLYTLRSRGLKRLRFLPFNHPSCQWPSQSLNLGLCHLESEFLAVGSGHV